MMSPDFEVDGRKAVLYGGIVRRGVCTFKPISELRRKKYYQDLSSG